MRRLLATVILLCPLAVAAADSDVVAVLDGKKITEAEITAPIANQLRQIRDSEYNLKKEATDRAAFELLQKQIAEKEGITIEALWKREVEGKIAAPTAAEIEATVRQYRAQLPPDEAQAHEMVAKALRQRRLLERESAWRDELLAAADYEVLLQPVRYPIAPLAGDASSADSAPVTIVEFSDFQCPYCASSQTVLDQLEKEYGDKVRVVFKQFPLESIHPQARLAAEASLCAQDQGKFWELHDWLFANRNAIATAKLVEVAPTLGIDGAALQTCIDEKQHAADVAEQIQQAQQLGVDSTPTFFVNGRKVHDRSFASFARMVEEELPN
ncbi:MAG: DsbA family protein [Thermoanaerobaculia bacterium]